MRKLAAGLLLAPTSFYALASSLETFLPVARAYPRHLPFLAGLALYPVAHFALFKPLRLYVFGHELTHALAALLSGVKVKKFVAGRDAGHVVVERSNVFIALAPYFIPIYSLVALGGFRLAAWWWPAAPLRAPFLVVMGLTLAFHLVLTLDILIEGQKDLQQAGGTVFSLSLIVLANAAVLVLLFKVLFPETVSLRAFGWAVGRGTLDFWKTLANTTANAIIRR